MEMLLDNGYPRDQMLHHESDLYIFVTPPATKVINEWCNEHGYRRSWNCPIFKDQITGKLMYDCAFQYYEEAESDAY